ncbi:nucleoside triphosphate pyrophosphohydrolase family protein [Candidatus Dojkabacteria bacterium]|uniref:Nucleoside triphosphate pyrophosphohydrolase family protein n=1 Tax=Candidatus Dojkabacteria bacterium TaxID=2099670 RepID=A0A955RK22_9BACT|nr:nucleoside triphosphate pyrophosphohydrolase family protein [Candidatus Dojkabacteria bacterium]
MDINTYLVESEKTLSTNFNSNEKTERLLHGAIGIVTESGELLDALKKKLYYGKELDVVNIKEELGDLMWYIAIILRELDFELEDILDLNISKLRSRYGETFLEHKALQRDLDTERAILEDS